MIAKRRATVGRDRRDFEIFVCAPREAVVPSIHANTLAVQPTSRPSKPAPAVTRRARLRGCGCTHRVDCRANSRLQCRRRRKYGTSARIRVRSAGMPSCWPCNRRSRADLYRYPPSVPTSPSAYAATRASACLKFIVISGVSAHASEALQQPAGARRRDFTRRRNVGTSRDLLLHAFLFDHSASGSTPMGIICAAARYNPTGNHQLELLEQQRLCLRQPRFDAVSPQPPTYRRRAFVIPKGITNTLLRSDRLCNRTSPMALKLATVMQGR
jgi:hypothetical protein